MISLFLNTSSNYLNLGLARNNKLIDSIYQKLDRDLSKETLYNIKKMLEKQNLKPKDIDEIICVKGPGSFTGLRVGVTIAKTFAHFGKTKLYSASSLEVMASSIKADVVVPIIDARRGYVYGAIYDKNYNTLMQECYIKLDELKEIAQKYEGEKVYVSNDEFSFEIVPYKPNLENFFICNFKTIEDPITFIPNYLKKPEAEEKLSDCKNNS